MMTKPDIRNLTSEALFDFIKEQNEKPFRLKQLQNWFWTRFIFSFDEITNMPKTFIEKIKAHYELTVCENIDNVESDDGTVKSVFRLFDDTLVEGVLIPAADRLTACLSTQVGCPVKCAFCATGTMGFTRNLSAAEIFAHFVRINNMAVLKYNRPLTNIVIMGMGEPLLNYDNVMRFVDILSNADGFNFSARRITLSTVGVTEGIKRLADEGARFNLALSLHAISDEKRNAIIPFNKHNNLQMLTEALKYYYDKTKNPVTFEYVLIKDFNDSRTDAKELVALCRKIPSKVNLIEFNPFSGCAYKKSEEVMVKNFLRILEEQNINCRLRKSKGGNINAACGQLVTKNKTN